MFYPQFIIVKFHQALNIEDPKPIFQFNVKERMEKYTLIGYCTYTGVHYTYTGKYNEDGWFVFNDNQISEE